jgi:tRNA-2-methylthio-N6-dimethylallyladenosine synthase
MKRGHTALEYKSKIRKLRKIRPDISLSSDFIIGFPGETDDDFEATMNLIAEVGFDHSFSFIYSKRPGTPAASFNDDVSTETKKERLNILQAKINSKAMEISRNMVGRTTQVLVEGFSKKNPEQLRGKTENNRTVNFSGPASLIGEFAHVLITEALPNSLRAELQQAPIIGSEPTLQHSAL